VELITPKSASTPAFVVVADSFIQDIAIALGSNEDPRVAKELMKVLFDPGSLKPAWSDLCCQSERS